MLQNHTWVNDACKVQDRPMDSNVTVKNLIDMVSDFILQINFKKLPHVNFWYRFKEKYTQLSSFSHYITFWNWILFHLL